MPEQVERPSAKEVVICIAAVLYVLLIVVGIVWGAAYLMVMDGPNGPTAKEGPYEVSSVSYVSGGLGGPSTILHLADGSTVVIAGHRSLPAVGKLVIIRKAAGLHAGRFVRFEVSEGRLDERSKS